MSLRDYLQELPPEALVPVRWVRDLLVDDARERVPEATAGHEPVGGYTVQRLAAELGRAPSTVRNWLSQGHLDGAYKFRGEWRIPRSAVELMLRRASAHHQAEGRQISTRFGEGPSSRRRADVGDLGKWRKHLRD